MKRFVCEDSFWELFPDAEISIMVLDHVRPSYQIPEEKRNQAAALLAEGNRQAEKWLDNPQISKNAVVAVWREVYRKFKGKKGAVCRTFNWRDGQRTAVSDETPHCVVVMELVDSNRSAGLHAALDELSGLVKDILGAEVVSLDYLTKDHPSTPLE